MKEQLQQRLNELKAEYESGQKMLAELETKQANLRNTLLRISGAIQVLEEELAKVEGVLPPATETMATKVTSDGMSPAS
jgi:predicted nuclease with TOPRIM domain